MPQVEESAHSDVILSSSTALLTQQSCIGAGRRNGAESGKLRAALPATAGTVGGGIARAFLQGGATVIAPLRSESSRPKLDAALQGVQFDARRLLVPLADWGTEEGATQLASFIRGEAGGAVDHVISICAGSVPLGECLTVRKWHRGVKHCGALCSAVFCL